VPGSDLTGPLALSPHVATDPVPAAEMPALVMPADGIVDAPALRAAVEAALSEAGGTGTARREAVTTVLRAAMDRGRASLAAAFAEAPHNARELAGSYAFLADTIVTTTLWAATELLHPLQSTSVSDRLALLAVGGYGRAEMAPYSDIDLLFLTPGKVTPWIETVVEEMLYILWDLRLKVGHATRNVKECIRLGREDYTIRTSLLEHRLLPGDAALCQKLTETLWVDL